MLLKITKSTHNPGGNKFRKETMTVRNYRTLKSFCLCWCFHPQQKLELIGNIYACPFILGQKTQPLDLHSTCCNKKETVLLNVFLIFRNFS